MRLDNKVTLVTGAAQGIGLGIAKVFAAEGAMAVLADVAEDLGQEAVEAIVADGGSAEFVRTDVVADEQVRALVEETVGRHGRVDVVVNNAGICTVKSCEESTVEEWDEVMNINVRAIFLAAKYAVPHMRRQGGGAILNIASISSFVGQQNTPAYCASKGAVLMLTKAMAVDYGPDKIRVNCLCPGITDTPLLRFHTRHEKDPDAHLEQRLERVPMGEMLYPEDMGKAAAFLCSDDAAGISGASLVIDGGYIACAEFFR
jgi:NAD(P)-dependent dehydrogenase (short-subunit alcohol dehydrogenase family)